MTTAPAKSKPTTVARPRAIDPWLVWEQDFPSGLDLETQLRFVLNYAVLAHSTYNTQPWLFDVKGDEILLRGDRNRSLPVVDPYGRALTMSCGAALYHLRLALRNFGFKAKVTILPDPAAEPYLFARLKVKRPSIVTPDEHLLFLAIPWARLSTGSFASRDVPEFMPPKLEAAAVAEGTWVKVVQDEDRRRGIAELVRDGGKLQWGDLNFRKELGTWLRGNFSRSRDGVPGYAMNLGHFASYVAPVFLRYFSLNAYDSSENYRLAMRGPTLMILGTSEENPTAWMAAGQSLARLILLSRSVNLSVGLFYEPLEIEELRRRMLGVIHANGYAQALLRLGYGRSVKPTPRRTVDEVQPKAPPPPAPPVDGAKKAQ